MELPLTENPGAPDTAPVAVDGPTQEDPPSDAGKEARGGSAGARGGPALPADLMADLRSNASRLSDASELGRRRRSTAYSMMQESLDQRGSLSVALTPSNNSRVWPSSGETNAGDQASPGDGLQTSI